MIQENTAILLFAEDTKVESLRKPLIKGSINQNIQIYSILNKRVKILARQTNLPLVHFRKQPGNSFGEKLHLQILKAFSLGFDRLIILGNDVPYLNKKILLQAAEALLQNEIVLGPTVDGGVYLIGIDKNTYSEKLISSIKWCTSEVQSNFKAEALESGMSILWTVELQDIDYHQALRRWASCKLDKVQRMISTWLDQLENQLIPIKIFLKNQYLYSLSGHRGPPIVSF